MRKMKLCSSFILSALLGIGLSGFSAAAVYANSEMKSFRGHTYMAIDSENMTWTEAKDFCEFTGGHLLTITDEAEQKFIEDLLTTVDEVNAYWMGLYRTEAGWTWIDGTAFSYENWNVNQPDNDGGVEPCGIIYVLNRDYSSFNATFGKWNDLREAGDKIDDFMTENLGYICEWDEDRVE